MPSSATPAQPPTRDSTSRHVGAWSVLALLALVTPVHWLTLGGLPRVVALTATCGGLLLVVALVAARSRPPVAARLGELSVGVALVNSLALAGAADHSGQWVPVVMSQVCTGVLLTRTSAVRRWLATGLVSGLALCAVTAEGIERGQLAAGLVAGTVVGAALHAARAQAVTRLQRQLAALADSKAALGSSERRYRHLFDRSPVGIALLDDEGRVTGVNQALTAVVGRPGAELVGERLEDHLGAPEARAQRRAVRRPDGASRWVSVTTSARSDDEGDGSVAHVIDVTNQVEAETRLRRMRDDQSAVADVVRQMHSGDDVRALVVQAARQIAGASSVSLMEPYGHEHLEVTAESGTSLVGLRVPLDEPSLTRHVWETGEALFVADAASHPLVSPALLAMIDAVSMLVLPVSLRGESWGLLHVSWGHRVEQDDDRAVHAVRMLATEAAVALERQSLIDSLEAMATTDPLTQLANRRSWDDGLAAAIVAAHRGSTTFTVALLDIDHFKAYNDEYGHGGGDELLSEFARAARASLREGDLIARWGGEEFAVLLQNCTSAADAKIAVDRVRSCMPLGTSCSAGFATWDRTESPQQLLLRADLGLYEAKRTGRNRAVAAPSATDSSERPDDALALG